VLHYSGKNRFTDRQVVLLARLFIVGIVTVTYILSLLNPVGVFTLGIWCFSGFSALVPLVVAAIYWRRLTKAGAYASVLTVAVSWSYFFYQSDFAANRSYTFLEMLPVVSMCVLSTVSLVLVSLSSSPPSDEVLERFFPRRPASSQPQGITS